MELVSTFDKPRPVKPSINIGALMDIPTGSYLFGRHGEAILNGGLANVTGVVGIGNNFKSTIAHYMNLSALNKVLGVYNTRYSVYDTEINISEQGLRRFVSKHFHAFKDKDLFESGNWAITDKVAHYANEWYELYKKFMKEKRKEGDKLCRPTPFLDRDGVSLMTYPIPTFDLVDSFSEFETEQIAGILNDNELGDQKGNTVHMRQGLDKTRFLMEIPALLGGGGGFMTLTAHVGKEIVMAQGPMAPPPIKKLQHLKNGDKIKGVTDKFFFLMLNCWQCANAAPYINDTTKAAEYPRPGEEALRFDTDLNLVKLTQLRGKNGLTGYQLQLLVSQSEGVLPSLSEFHYCKENGRFGLGGNNLNYFLDLHPDVKLGRTTVRGKLDNDELLARAMNVTSEMLQMQQYWPVLDAKYRCTPKELYDDLTKLGWNVKDLLDSRGWWSFDNDEQPVPMLSTMDFLRMRTGEYFPYWMNPDKTRKEKYPSRFK